MSVRRTHPFGHLPVSLHTIPTSTPLAPLAKQVQDALRELREHPARFEFAVRLYRRFDAANRTYGDAFTHTFKFSLNGLPEELGRLLMYYALAGGLPKPDPVQTLQNVAHLGRTMRLDIAFSLLQRGERIEAAVELLREVAEDIGLN